MAEGDWLVKQRYGPSYQYESVLGNYTGEDAELRARKAVSNLNFYAQTDEYYAEAWDAAKATLWPRDD